MAAKLYWCPLCHHRVDLPAMLVDGSVKVEGSANIEVVCGNCGRGRVQIDVEALK